mgnify:FL=1
MHDISAGGLITTLLEMCFSNVEGGMEISLDKMKEQDIVKILFAENPGIVIQISDKHKDEVKKILEDHGGKVWATSRLGIGTIMYFVLRKYQEVPMNE